MIRSGVGAICPRCRPVDFFPVRLPVLLAFNFPPVDFVPGDLAAPEFDAPDLVVPDFLVVVGLFDVPLVGGFAEEFFVCLVVVAAAGPNDTIIAPIPVNSSATLMVCSVVITLGKSSPKMRRGISLTFSGKRLAARLKIYF